MIVVLRNLVVKRVIKIETEVQHRLLGFFKYFIKDGGEMTNFIHVH